ncbi:MAG: NrtA/SsuA/CpmA family ABC transporter substrate-binding protein [Syntrophobacterales bacterium]|nr:NrtA/SsuA/CpmA family ABC transporter substrate-binding protein [Syntrophobacterales bacterium]
MIGKKETKGPASHPRENKRFSIRAAAISAVLILVAGSCFLVSCWQGEPPEIKEKIRLGASKAFMSIPVFVAKKKGYFAKEGLDVEVKEYGSGKMATQALFAGEVDISTVADVPVVFNSFKRDDFRVFATFTHSYSLVRIIARKDCGIRTGADMKGKKVGANRGTSSHYYLGAFLIHSRLSFSEVEIIDIKTPDMADALKNNKVDAISVWQPYSQKAMKLLGDNAIELPGGNIFRATFNFAAMKSFAKEHPKTLKRFLGAIDRAGTFIKKNREEAQDIIAEVFKLDKDTVSAAWDDFTFELSLDQALLVSWDDIARWAIQNRFVDGKTLPNYFKLIDTNAMDAVQPEAITIIR